jgi:hypothetical protein
MTLPLWIKKTAGMLLTLSAFEICGKLSIFNFTSLNFPYASAASYSRTGVNFLQGPHQL